MDSNFEGIGFVQFTSPPFDSVSSFVKGNLLFSLLSHVQLCVTTWIVALQVSLTMRILQAKILEWVAMAFSRGSSQFRDRIQVSRIAGGFFAI